MKNRYWISLLKTKALHKVPIFIAITISAANKNRVLFCSIEKDFSRNRNYCLDLDLFNKTTVILLKFFQVSIDDAKHWIASGIPYSLRSTQVDIIGFHPVLHC